MAGKARWPPASAKLTMHTSTPEQYCTSAECSKVLYLGFSVQPQPHKQAPELGCAGLSGCFSAIACTLCISNHTSHLISGIWMLTNSWHMQDSARRQQHAAADNLNRSLITEGARHRCEEQEREKAATRSATQQEVTYTPLAPPKGGVAGIIAKILICTGFIWRRWASYHEAGFAIFQKCRSSWL